MEKLYYKPRVHESVNDRQKKEFVERVLMFLIVIIAYGKLIYFPK